MGAPESNTTNIYGIHLRESANDGSDFSNAAADYRVLFLGEDGELHTKDSAGSVAGIGGVVTEITDLPTAETDTDLRLAPDGAGGVEWSTGGSGSADPFGWGMIFTADPGYTAAAGVVLAQNVCRYMRVMGSGAITKVGLHITVSNGNIAIAHYTGTGTGSANVPANRVATTGAIASPGTGYQEISLSTTIAAGDWLAISTDSATFATLVAGAYVAGASGLAKGRSFAQSAAHPCPATVGTLDAGNPIVRVLIGIP